MEKILVCGGTGFVGSAIVNQLSKTDHQVRVLTRKIKKESNRGPNVEMVEGNLFDSTSLENAMRGCDVVINAAQFDNAPFENRSKGQTYEKVDGDGTENIVKAAIKMNIARILYMSGAGVEEGKTENWFKAKLRAEKAIQHSGMKWTIFRPSWIYGPGDRSLNRMIPMIKYSPIVWIIGKNYKIQPIYINDVAQVVAAAVDDPKTVCEIYHLAGPDAFLMKEIMQKTAHVLGKKRLYASIPKTWMGIVFSILEKVPGVPIARAALDFITMDGSIPETELKKTQNAFSMQFQPLEKALKNYL